MNEQLLQKRLGHQFKDVALLQQALTHRSHSTTHNERLEFLGDSILNCVVASILFETFERIDEGDLSRVRANLVKQQSLFEIAQKIQTEMTYPGQIKVTVIREKRAVNIAR